jgi:hypothetical protein
MDPITIAAMATNFMLPAIKSLGEQVLTKSEDAASDAVVGFGSRLLQLFLRRRKKDDAPAALERRVLAIAHDPGQPDAQAKLTGAIEDLLYADSQLLAAVTDLLRHAPAPVGGSIQVQGDSFGPNVISSTVGSIHNTVNHGEDPATVGARHLAAGRRHLEAGDCPASLQELRQAQSYGVDSADVHYLSAVALLGHRSAFRAAPDSARQVERTIRTAIIFDDRPLFHYFLAYLYYDFYERNSFRPPGSWQDALQYARSRGITQPEIDSLFHLLAVGNPFSPSR